MLIDVFMHAITSVLLSKLLSELELSFVSVVSILSLFILFLELPHFMVIKRRIMATYRSVKGSNPAVDGWPTYTERLQWSVLSITYPV